jgi:cobalt-zinc-cadmium efflux system outer membrane protein
VKKIILYILFIISCAKLFAQQTITEQQVIDTILNNNYLLSNAMLKIDAQRALQKTSWNISDPEIFVEQNPFESLTLSVEQTFDFPSQYIKQGQLNREKTALSEKEYAVTKSELLKNIRLLYLQAQYASAKLNYLQLQDSVFNQIKDASAKSFESGNTNYLEKIFAETKYGEMHQQFINEQAELVKLKKQISILTAIQYDFAVTELAKLNVKNDSIMILQNPSYLYAEQNVKVTQKQYEAVKAQVMPDILLGYTAPLKEDAVYTPAYKAGISIPLWVNAYSGNNAAAKAEIAIAENNLRIQERNLIQQKTDALTAYYGNEQTVRYYEKEGLPNATEITKTAMRLKESGEIDFMNYLRTLNDAFEIQLNYIEALRNYNSSVIEIDYLNGN